MSQDQSIFRNLGWKLLERGGVQGIQFVLQIVLARILVPEQYGALSLMLVFVSLANVFVQSGFNTALIQNKDVTEEDYSSVFWVSLGIAVFLYIVLFFAAPVIANFYKMQELIMPFRALCLMLIPGAFNSVQLAKVSRELDFQKVFYSNVGGIIISGIVGILIAMSGGGLWALVVQTMLNVLVACIVMCFTVQWHPRFVCKFRRVGVLFSFGWKLLVSALLDTLYQEVRGLVIGKKYDSSMLGYYNRGKQFPQFVINSVNNAVQSVLLPVMSAEQDNKEKVKVLMRSSVMLSSYIIFPIMAGLAGVASPMIEFLLTDKWLPSVPFMQIYCFNLAFYPIHTSNLQAINAMGRSDIFLKLEVVKKTIGLILLGIAIYCFDSPIAIALTGVFSAISSSFINAYPTKKLIDYGYLEQMKDILPPMLAALVVFGIVSSIQLLNLGILITLVLQILVGVLIYVGLSSILKLEAYKILLEKLKIFLNKGKG